MDGGESSAPPTIQSMQCFWEQYSQSFHFSRRHVIAFHMNPLQSRLFAVIICRGADEDIALLSCRFKPISVMRRHLSAPLRPLIPQWGSRVTAVCKSGPLLTAASCQCATTGGSRATRTRRVLSWDSESRRSHHYHFMSFWFKKKLLTDPQSWTSFDKNADTCF